MAKRRSKIKTGVRTGPRITRRKGPAKQPVSTRILTQKLDLNSVQPYDETCEGKDIHEEEVKGLDDIDTKTATAERGQDCLSENIRSSDEPTERPAKMKKCPAVKGKPTQLDKAPCTCPRDVDGEMCLDVECGNNNALLYLSKLCVGSKGACIEHDGSWLTPNEFQFVSGRETAKDWKRSIRHNGFSLKLLIVNGCIELNASPPPTSPTTPPVVASNNNNNIKKQEGVVKADKTTNGVEGKRRRYIPVKRRAAAVKDKVVGRRRKIRRAKKKPASVNNVTTPVLECPEDEIPEVAEVDKSCKENTACESDGSDTDVAADIQEPEVEAESVVDEKQSEEFFKTLQLSKTPSSSTANSPVATDIPDADNNVAVKDPPNAVVATGSDAQESATKTETGDTENVLDETTDDQTPKVVETFRSRLLPDETGLRIAINREVVCMKDTDLNETVLESDAVPNASDAKLELHITDNSNIHDLNKHEAGESVSVVCKESTDNVIITTDSHVETKPTESVKQESPTDSEEKANVKELQKPLVQTDVATKEIFSANRFETKTECKTIPMTASDCKCVDLKDKDIFNVMKKPEISTASPRSYGATFSPKESTSIIGSIAHKTCTQNSASLNRCDYSDHAGRDKDFASKEARLHKHITANSIKCNRKIQDSRVMTPKSVAESTFQEKSQYENDMLELMSIYRPVMVPCDGRCPYVCNDSTSSSPRQLSDTHSPYAACSNSKWPAASPFLSGVMTPEMMYYMTQQLYYDMYNSSLYAQCASNEKLSQAKTVKRKLPEPDQDSPLDLTVKKAKTDRESSKVLFTQDLDSPVDFSRKSNFSYDRKVTNVSKHLKTPMNGALLSNGYRPKASPQNSAEKQCTCGKKDDIRNWNVEKVCSFLKQCHDCAIYTKTFREQGIDGRLLPYLTMQHLTRTLGMQTGPAATFLGAVDQQLRGNALQRYCQWCKG